MVLLAIGVPAAAASEFQIRNETEFRKLIPAAAKLEKLAGGMRFIEGPVWMPQDGGFLVFSDIPANELKKWSRAAGVTTFRRPSGNANGNTIDRRGRLITAEHGGRRVSLTEKSGIVMTVVDSFDGKKLNSPNDVVVKSDDSIWFTDPPYGVPQGERREQAGNYVYRYDPRLRLVLAVITDFDRPNGLCFSPDESKLYVADSGKPRHIRSFQVQSNGAVSGGSVFAVIDKGEPDGIRSDADGRLWVSAGDGVRIYAPNGVEIGRILVPEAPTNLTFGGRDGKTLFITARSSLYAIAVSVTGASRR